MQDAVKLTCAACGQTNRVPVAKLTSAPKCGICGEALASGKVAELDQQAHDKATKTDELPIVVDYWAPWCGPCRMMAPEFSKAAGSLKGKARLVKRNATLVKPGQAQVYLPGDIHDTLCVSGPALLFRFTERDLKHEDAVEKRITRYVQRDGFWSAP